MLSSLISLSAVMHGAVWSSNEEEDAIIVQTADTAAFAGFMVIGIIAVVAIFLLMDMVRRIRRTRYREQVLSSVENDRTSTEKASVLPGGATHSRPSRPRPAVWLSVTTTVRSARAGFACTRSRSASFVLAISSSQTSSAAREAERGRCMQSCYRASRSSFFGGYSLTIFRFFW
jgi:hypothetical protein